MKSIATLKLTLVAMTVGVLFQQPTQNVIYLESWKKGPRRIEEKQMFVHLSATKPTYDALLKDSSGKARYKLSLWPGYVSSPGSGIVEWMVELTELLDGEKTNLLKPTYDPEQDYFTAQDRVAWLYPLEDPKSKGADTDIVPFLAKRVIKVEGFYCTIQVKAFKPSPSQPNTLDSIDVSVGFTNHYSGQAKD